MIEAIAREMLGLPKPRPALSVVGGSNVKKLSDAAASSQPPDTVPQTRPTLERLLAWHATTGKARHG
jgi:hypothetical protein